MNSGYSERHDTNDVFPHVGDGLETSERHFFRGRGRDQRPLVYSSLPPTPIPATSPVGPESPGDIPMSPSYSMLPYETSTPFSIWDYLREELLATDFDSHQEMKWERVSNFLSIPIAIEKVRIAAQVEGPIADAVRPAPRLWVHSMLRLLLVHIHYPAYTRDTCLLPPMHEHVLCQSATAAPFSEG